MTTTPLEADRSAILRRRIRIVVAITITWNIVEAGVALIAGGAASSAALIGFGLDSIVEVLSAASIAWQFAAPDPKGRENVALRIIAVSFFGLAAYVAVDATLSLAGFRDPEHSPVGIVIAALSLAVMPFLSWFERRTGRELGSASAVADSKQTLVCTYLSAALLLGLLLNGLFGWSWADSVAALVIAVVAVREGVAAWRGDACCAVPVGVLTDEQPINGFEDDCCDQPSQPRQRATELLSVLPIACALTPDAGRVQLARWRAFDADYALSTERTDSQIVVHYARDEESARQLQQLVATERECCSFVNWTIIDGETDLRLIVTGTRDQLAAVLSSG